MIERFLYDRVVKLIFKKHCAAVKAG